MLFKNSTNSRLHNNILHKMKFCVLFFEFLIFLKIFFPILCCKQIKGFFIEILKVIRTCLIFYNVCIPKPESETLYKPGHNHGENALTLSIEVNILLYHKFDSWKQNN